MAVSERVLEIFKFIDFLYLNINEFNKYNVLINECITLRDKKDSIDVSSNYKLKLEYDTIYEELSSKNKIFVKFRVQPILSLAVELRIIDRDDRGGSTIETNCYRYLRDLKDDFEVKDVSIIKEYRIKYLKFRKEVSCKNVLSDFFQELDKCFIPFFEFFKEVDDENQFDELENEFTEVDSLEQFCTHSKLGSKVKMTFPFNLQTNEKKIIETENSSNEVDKREKTHWFVIGVKLATGEIQKLYEKEANFTEIARNLGNEKGFRPYISSSLGIEKLSDSKNIYMRKESDLLFIEKYCIDNDLEIVCPKFISKLKLIQRD